MGRSHNSKKRSNSFNDSVTSPPRCSEVDSSGSLCDSSGTIGSDILAGVTPIAEKPQKRKQAKRGRKKKGKPYRRSTMLNFSTALEGRCEETTCVTNAVENSVVNAPDSLGKHAPGLNLLDSAIFPSLSAEDTTRKKDDSETNTEYVDSSATVMSCIAHSDGQDSTSRATCHRERKSSSAGMISEKIHPERTMISEKIHPERTVGVDNNSFSNSLNPTAKHDVDPALESFQDCSDISRNCRNNIGGTRSRKGKGGLGIQQVVDSESLSRDDRIIKDSPLCDPYFSVDVLRQGSTERGECSSQACNNNVVHPVISGKRGRTGKKVNSRSGKDSNNSVWKKVQKLDTEHSTSKKKDVHAIPRQVDFAPKYCDTMSVLNRSESSDCLKQNDKGKVGRYELINQTSKPYLSKIASSAIDQSENNGKKKLSSELKPVNHCSRNGLPNGNAAPLSRPSKGHGKKKNRLRVSQEVNEGDLNDRSESTSACSNDCQPLAVKPTEIIDACHSEHQQQVRNYSDEGLSSENTCSTSDTMTSAVQKTQIDSSVPASDSLSHIPMEVHVNVKEHNNLLQDLFLMDRDGRCKNMQSENPQKWVPVERKETVVSCASLTDDNMKTSTLDESIPDKRDVKLADEDTAKLHSSVTTDTRELQYLNCSTAERHSLSPEADKLTCDMSCAPRELVGLLESSPDLSNEVQYHGLPQSECDSEKIVRAIKTSYDSQASAEAAQEASGTPLAEFEKFIRSTSPVISQRSHRIRCNSCFQEQFSNGSCCRHQINNISLEKLWQWYEEPGCYGLEVKTQEKINSKRQQNGSLEFKAYFVPYLSAVQLFGRPGFHNTRYDADKGAMLQLESLPISAELLPQFRMDEDACLHRSASSFKNRLPNHSTMIGKSNGEELIFEYFEHAQPPQRRPLFEKIKELVNGDIPSCSKIYGDASKLECMNLHDLHPASWFSVAWYPIYRIPEGNFRAAFLTYHSLGHFLHQSSSTNTTDDFTHIVSPVVGLQSYNAKKECWFKPTVSDCKNAHEVLSSKISTVLEDRLKTLEHTASVMATAAVSKDNQRHSNYHPDYNHFLSRW